MLSLLCLLGALLAPVLRHSWGDVLGVGSHVSVFGTVGSHVCGTRTWQTLVGADSAGSMRPAYRGRVSHRSAKPGILREETARAGSRLRLCGTGETPARGVSAPQPLRQVLRQGPAIAS